ncbi:FAD-dependent monooxygenase [Halobacillus salinarum]|uniref:FAD-dependent monooxygenase n=1 Tax=Halobacillus salinarum TaxID=2932257 RepID=A0ABY4EQK6_9BACI|nr:FAD-dependent monooxygenase [Halobacillus salinarum]UOQ46468.1 FAD-dependent monooxygenase [Halobacillus salinarum]
MEFNWDETGVKEGIGGNDAELLSKWPGLLYDNTRDYIMWGFAASQKHYPENVRDLQGSPLKKIVQSHTENWHSNFQTLLEETDASTVFSINIRTSERVSPWDSSNVTLIGDAIHTMTPGRGVGANTALRDAALLSEQLLAAVQRKKPLSAAIGEYESKMRDYGFEAVEESRKQQDDSNMMHKPIIGRAALFFMRSTMRFINHTPPLKRYMTNKQNSFRGADRKDE